MARYVVIILFTLLSTLFIENKLLMVVIKTNDIFKQLRKRNLSLSKNKSYLHLMHLTNIKIGQITPFEIKKKKKKSTKVKKTIFYFLKKELNCLALGSECTHIFTIENHCVIAFGVCIVSKLILNVFKDCSI